MATEILQIDKSDLEDIFRDVVRFYNNQNKTKIISTEEAMGRLNLKRTAFYELQKDAKTLLKKSKKGNGYLESSVEAEVIRLTSDEVEPIYINNNKKAQRRQSQG